MDVLSEILRTLRLRAKVFLHACFYGNWAVDTSGEHRATFHLVVRGGCWLHMPGRPEPVALTGGDLIVFPHDAVHTITNSRQPVDDGFPRNELSEKNDGGPGVTLVCGYFDFEHHRWNPLLDALPDLMIIRDDGMARVPLSDTLGKFLVFEVESEDMGSDLVVDKLSEILFTYVVRNHLRAEKEQGFLAAIADERIGKALSKIHEAPSENWTVERLANVAGMSRSSFAERFNRLAKISPMQYLSRWRMTKANEFFLTTHYSVAKVADLSGYESEVAFAKAFKKHFGYGPGEARKKRILAENA